MKQRLSCLLLLGIVTWMPITAQRSNQWMLGWIGKMDFNSGSSQYSLYSDTIFINASNAGICDTNGQILFWTNGGAIFQNNRDSMQNGSLFHFPFSQSYAQIGMINLQGALALPLPGNANLYYCFYTSIDLISTAPTLYQLMTSIFYSIVDMSANGGLGAVISNSQFLEDSVHWGNMTAVRHGNGRDWWLVSHEYNTSNLFTWLISPQGISQVSKIQAGIVPSYQRYGQMTFSSDGNYFAQTAAQSLPVVSLTVYEFDRCLGIFTQIKSDVSTDLNSLRAGCQFSQSGRFVYKSTYHNMYQYDMLAPNFAASKVLIGSYDGTYAPFEADFNLMQRAADGKIYCHARNGNWTLHVINEPDSAGMASNFVQNGFWPAAGTSLNIVSLPNMPNYELGPLVGSPCDTLTDVTEINVTSTGINIYPNPTAGSLGIQLPTNTTGKVRFELVDLLGRKVYLQDFINRSKMQTILLPTEITNGVYVCRWVTDGRVYSEKLILDR